VLAIVFLLPSASVNCDIKCYGKNMLIVRYGNISLMAIPGEASHVRVENPFESDNQLAVTHRQGLGKGELHLIVQTKCKF
jgi:hypothetical protein